MSKKPSLARAVFDQYTAMAASGAAWPPEYRRRVFEALTHRNLKGERTVPPTRKENDTIVTHLTEDIRRTIRDNRATVTQALKAVSLVRVELVRTAMPDRLHATIRKHQEAGSSTRSGE